jgi:hypothetical protein
MDADLLLVGNLLVVVWSWPALVYVSIVAHELGHALAGWAMGFTITSFGLGIGRPFAVLSLGRTRFYLGITKPLQGLTFGLPPVFYPPRRTMVPFLAGGIIANILLLVGALALCRWVPSGRSLWLTAAVANAFLAIPSLIPFQFKIGKASLRNDGRLIVQTLRDRVISQSPFEVVQTLKALRPLWKSIGDDATLRILLKQETTEAAGKLKSLTCHPLLAQSSWFQSYVYSFCVQAHAARSDLVGADQSLVSYETARSVCPSTLRDYRVH